MVIVPRFDCLKNKEFYVKKKEKKMPNINTVEGNEIIAEWLNWKRSVSSFGTVWYQEPVSKYRFSATDNIASRLKFDYDSNHQWICLEKIGKLEELSIDCVIQELSIFNDINTKEDLFKAIVSYINSHETESEIKKKKEKEAELEAEEVEKEKKRILYELKNEFCK